LSSANTDQKAWALPALSAVTAIPLDIRVSLARCLALPKAIQGCSMEGKSETGIGG